MNWFKSIFGGSDDEEEKRNDKLNAADLESVNQRQREKMIEDERLRVPHTMVRQTPRNGLYNLGNTCFMSSALQCLMHVYEINGAVIKGDWVANLNTVNHACRGRMIVEYHRLLVKALCSDMSSRDVLDPSKIKSTIKSRFKTFAGYAQQDSQEFLSFFIDALHEDVNKVLRKPYEAIKDYAGQPISELAQDSWDAHLRRNNSMFVDYFFGQFYTKIVCPTCAYTSITFDPFDMVSLNVPSTIEFECYFAPLTSQDPILSVRFNYKSNVSLGDAVNFLKSQLKSKKILVTKSSFKFHSRIIQTKEDIHVQPLPHAMSNSSFVFIDEIFDKGVYALAFGEASAEVVEQSLASAERKNVTISGFVESKQISVERELPVPADLSLRTLLRFLFVLHRRALVKHDKKIFEGFDEPLPAETQLLDKELAQLYPEGKYNEKKSPFNLTVQDKTINEFSSEEPLFKTPEERSLKVEIFFNPTLMAKLSLKQVVEFKPEHEFEVNIQDCLDYFVQPETLDANNLWYCSKCKEHKPAQKTMMLYRPPKILIIHLKRFRKVEHSLYFRKNKMLIHFPLEDLDLKPFIFDHPKQATYDLFAVSNHIGSLGDGHYTAFCKNQGKDWNLFDDESVKPISPKQVVTEMAYILFYRRKD